MTVSAVIFKKLPVEKGATKKKIKKMMMIMTMMLMMTNF